MKKIFRSKIFWSVIVVIVLIRVGSSIILLDRLNKFLAGFSTVYAGHVDDLGISFFRGAYQLRGLELRLKEKKNELFLIGKVVDVSLAWRELLHLRVTTDIEIDGLDVTLTKTVIDAFKSAPKQAEEETRKAGRKIFPVRVERIDLKDSSFEFAELISIPDSKRWRMTKIEARASNATPTSAMPLMFVTVSGALFDAAKVKAVAQVNTKVTPTAWDVDLELRNFELSEANAWLKHKLPMTFTSGKLDLFAEARSMPTGFEGYVKPFLRNADIVAEGESFSGFKQFDIEVSVATANLILRTSRDKIMATKILFASENGEFKVNSAKAIAEAFKNGFGDPLPSGLDNEISLSKENMESKPEVRK